MNRFLLATICLFISFSAFNQNRLSSELLWKLKRVQSADVSPDGNYLLYQVKSYSIEQNSGNSDLYIYDFQKGTNSLLLDKEASVYNAKWGNNNSIYFMKQSQLWKMGVDGSSQQQVTSIENGISDYEWNEDESKLLYFSRVKIDRTLTDFHADLPQAQARIIDDLMFRHWDEWSDYSYTHVYYGDFLSNTLTNTKDITPGKPYSISEAIWSKSGNSIIYTSKKKKGKQFALSTNSDIYQFNLSNNTTTNLSQGILGYDQNPTISPLGKIAWLSMAKDGFESDKKNILLKDQEKIINLTESLEQTINDYKWSEDGKKIFFTSPIKGTVQVFELTIQSKQVRQVTNGQHNILSIDQKGKELICQRQTIQYPTDIFSVSIKKGKLQQLTSINSKIYDHLEIGKVEERWIETTDHQQMLAWVTYPPDFDSTKKYPTLLYCQGGPQSPVTQFFSYRWNFQLMAANGYIVIAPNRRGLPGFGRKWNDDISGDWGGQPMDDYLAAIDDISKESYVDASKLGAVGASYGGYSVYYLAGIHKKRFKTFISHCGVFNLESWYGATEEMFFANWDMGGPYWQKETPKSFTEFSPHDKVNQWDTPMMVIHCEKDFRVPIGEGLQAFNAAQLKDIPSRFLYFPNEGHWVLAPQNALVWQREFYKWLDEWLK